MGAVKNNFGIKLGDLVYAFGTKKESQFCLNM